MLMESREDKLRPPPQGETPWLLYGGGFCRHSQKQIFCTMSPSPPNNKAYVRSIPELRNSIICASCHGWLVLYHLDEDDSKCYYSLWNPVTMRTIRVPPRLDERTRDENVSTCILTKDPDDCEDNDTNPCMLVMFHCDGGFVSSCRPTGDDCTWVTHRLEIDGETVQHVTITALDGVIYGWASTIKAGRFKARRVFFSVDVSDNDESYSLILRSLHIKEPEWDLPYLCTDIQLVESCGRIYYVCRLDRYLMYGRYIAVRVSELDLQEKIFKETKTLNGRSFFLGDDCCTWCWGSNNSESRTVEGNNIYFLTQLSRDMESSLCSYSLDCGSLMVLWPLQDLNCPSVYPVWLMPQCERSSERGRREQIVFGGDVCEEDTGTVEQIEQLQIKGGSFELFNQLPQPVKELISRYMHLFDYWNFRASGKLSETTVAPPPQWRTNNSLPLFMFMMNDSQQCKVMDPCQVDSVIFKFLQYPLNIEFSKNGWLIVCVGKKSLHIFNPFTKQRMRLPQSKDLDVVRFHSIGFSTNPTCSLCLTVAIADTGSVKIVFLRTGDKVWSICSFDHGDIQFSPSNTSPLYYKGVFYFVSESGHLGEFKLVDGDASWKVYDRPETTKKEIYSCHLVECDGELFMVVVALMGYWLQVFKWNGSKVKWIEVNDLGKNVLFVSNSSSYSVEAKDMSMRNRIYLPQFRGSGIIYYSLETEKYHVLGSEDALEDFFSTMEPLNSCWI